MKCIKGMTEDTCRYNPRLGCDCGYHVGVTAEQINSTVFPRLCHKCKQLINKKDLYVFRGEMTIVNFHKDCFNGYEHYYGLDKPID